MGLAVAHLAQADGFDQAVGGHALDQRVSCTVIESIVAAGSLYGIDQAGQRPVDTVFSTGGVLQAGSRRFHLADFLELGAHAGQVVAEETSIAGSRVCLVITRTNAGVVQPRHVGGGRWLRQLVGGFVVVGAVEAQGHMQGLGAGWQGRRVVAPLCRVGGPVPGLLIAFVLQATVGGHILRRSGQTPALGQVRRLADGLGGGGIQRAGHVVGSSSLSGSL
ncbi:hypothetical protein FQZ97_781130 [compost metagenome]